MEHLFTSERTGIKRHWRDNNDGTYSVIATQDLDGVLDFCKAAATHNDGYSGTRELKRVFFLPDILVLKWLSEEGWYAYDPNSVDKLNRKMNDPDYAHLKTSPGRIGVQKRMN